MGMKYETLIVSILFILMPAVSFGSGFSAWSDTTPYGHEMEHDGTEEGWILLRLDTTSVSFKHFYFYKNHTIAYSDSLYFIVNEQTESIQEFTQPDRWQAALATQHLQPIWKREYDANYSSDKVGMVLLVLMIPIPFLGPVLWLVCVISLFFSSRKWYSFRKHYAWIYPLLLLSVYIFVSVPQSL
jgi:hypothetical protein